MPDQYERHSRNNWEWGTFPGRKQQRQQAADDDPRHDKTPGKKDPSYCKSSDDHEHHPVLVLESKPGYHCHWLVTWISDLKDFGPAYLCMHAERCSACGKRFRRHVKASEECPDYTRVIPDFSAEIQERRVKYAARQRKWFPVRKEPPAGPSHYRKPKGK